MKHPITKIVLPITLSAFLLTGCQSPSSSVSSPSLSQPSTVIPSATVSPVPDEPASSTPMVENPQDTASGAEPSEDIMQKQIDTSDWMPAESSDIDLAEIEDFLNDSKLLGVLSGRNTKVILSESDESRQYLRWAVSLCLTQAASSKELPLQTNEDGVPYFPISDFEEAAYELFGIQYDFSSLAESASDRAPDGMLCVTWGYENSLAGTTIQENTLLKGNGEYSAILENQFYNPGEDPTVYLEQIVFSQNNSYRFSPIRISQVKSIQ